MTDDQIKTLEADVAAFLEDWRLCSQEVEAAAERSARARRRYQRHHNDMMEAKRQRAWEQSR